MGRSAVLRIGIVVVVASVAAGVFALVGRADNPNFDNISASLQPAFVDAGGTVLYKAQWHDNDNRSFTHAEVQITIPAGWTLLSSSPSGCTQNDTLVTCAWGTLHFDELIAQEVRLQTNSVLGTATVNSLLSFYEGPGNPGRQNRLRQAAQQTEVISSDPTVTPDKAGNCVSGNGSIATEAGSGGSDTSATAPSTDELCTPITIDEQPRHDPTEFCLPGRDCVSDIVLTNAAAVPTTTPIKLKIVFRGTGLNNRPLIFTSAVGQFEVPACTDPAAASPDPCYSAEPRARQQSVTWFLNWSGLDPGWDL